MPSFAARLVCGLVLVAAARPAAAASLVLTSGQLQLETFSGSTATANISESSGTITITSSETIGLGNLPSWTGDGTTTVSGPASVMTAGFLELFFVDVNFTSDFAATGGQVVINSPVVITGNVHLTAPNGIVIGALQGSTDGAYDFTAEVTGSGNILVNGNIGDVSRPKSLSFSVGAGSFIEPAATMSSTGAQLYTGTVGLQVATTMTGDSITLGDVVPLGNSGLSLHGNSTLSGNIGGVSGVLTSFTVAAGTATFAGGSVDTSGMQSYGNVLLAADTTLTGAGVNVFGTIDGVYNLTVAGDALFSGNIGGTTPLVALDVSGATTMTNAENSTTIVTLGDQHYSGAVTLEADTTWSGANVTNDHGVDGAQALTINASTAYHANGAIGSLTPLTAFAVHGPTTWTAGTLMTTTSAHFYDALVLATGMTVASAQINFDSTVDGADPITATGATTFGGVVGGATPLAAITVNGATHLGAASVSNDGAQQYLGPLTVTAAARAVSTGSFAITFGGAIDRGGGGPFSLATTTHTGIVFASGATCDFVLAGPTAGSEYTQIVSDAAVTLDDCTLHATSTAAGPFPAGTAFVVISGGPVSGTFAGLAQDAHTTINGQDFTVDYAHGGVRFIAQALADMGPAASPDLAQATDDLGGEADLGAVDLGAVDLGAVSTGGDDAATAGGGHHSGCAYTLGGESGSGAAVSLVAILLWLALARRRVSGP